MPYAIGGRVTLAAGDPWTGAVADMDEIVSTPVYAMVLARVEAFAEAPSVEAEVAALTDLYRTVETVGRPTWNLVNARGPIEATVGGMLSVPVPLMLHLVGLWTDGFAAEPPTPEEVVTRARRSR